MLLQPWSNDRVDDIVSVCVSKCLHFLERFISEKISYNRFICIHLPSRSSSVFHFSFREDDRTVVIFSQLDNLNRLGFNKNTSNKHTPNIWPFSRMALCVCVGAGLWMWAFMFLFFFLPSLFFSGPSFLRIIFIIVNENIPVMCTHAHTAFVYA